MKPKNISNCLFTALALSIFFSRPAICQPIQLLPEWKAQTGVAIDLQTTYQRARYYHPSNPFIFDVLRERLGLANTLAQALGPSKVLILGGSISAKNLVRSLYSHRLNTIFPFIPDIPSLDIENNEGEDEWTRDYIGFPAIVGSRRTLVNLSNRGLRSTTQISTRFNLSLLDHSLVGLEGGNLMVDEAGTCFSTDQSLLQKLVSSKICPQNVMAESLPYEGTGHIDLFAKLLNSQTVVLSRFINNKVEISEIATTVTQFGCGDSVTSSSPQESFLGCKFEKQTGHFSSLQLMKEQGLPKMISIQEIPSFVQSKWGANMNAINANVKQSNGAISSDTPMSSIDWSRSLVEHGHSVEKVFRQRGLSVVNIPAPPPILTHNITIYKSRSGQVIRQELTIELMFRSYTNALIFGRHLFIPSFSDYVDEHFEEKISSVFRGQNFEVIKIPMNRSFLGGGTVHCLTREF